MPVLYSYVARGQDVLVDCTLPNHEANFLEISLKILKKSNAGPADLDQKKLTYIYEGHTFNYIGVGRFIFLCVADEAAGRILPFSFLNEVSEAFVKAFRDDATAEACSAFRTVLSQRMNKYSTIGSSEPSGSGSSSNASGHPAAAGLSGVGTVSPNGAIDLRPTSNGSTHNDDTSTATDGRSTKVKGLQRGLEEVKGIMALNIEKVMQRGEALDSLMDKSDHLTHSSERFKSSSRRLRQTLCMADVKTKIIIGIGVILLIYLLMATACGFGLDKC